MVRSGGRHGHVGVDGRGASVRGHLRYRQRYTLGPAGVPRGALCAVCLYHVDPGSAVRRFCASCTITVT